MSARAEYHVRLVYQVLTPADLLSTKESMPSLRHVVCIEPPSQELSSAAAAKNVRVHAFTQIEKLGADAEKRPLRPPAPTSIATVCYTSGTTGLPKGAIITHGNVIAAAAALEYFRHVQLGPDDIEMSFLPLAHMFERLIQAACYQIGGKVGFFSGDIKLLSDDFQKLKPTIVAVVPRVLNRIYDAVQQQCASGVKRKLLEWALASKTAQLNQGILRNDTFWDSIVFRKVRNRMGGRLKLVFTGAAPLGEHVLTFTRCALGCVVVEGYGQTECAAACSVTLEGDHTPGHVGVPCPACEIKLVDVPDMEYFAAQGKGEICVRGHNVFQGYYNDAEKTSEALDSDGWLHTGDVGTWTSSGVLKIIDRKKNLLKLAQGEYVSPEKVETVYISSTLVGQIFVHGESLKSCLIAVVVPDEEVLPRKVAQSLPHLKDKDVKALCAEPEVKKLISADMLAVAKKAGLHSFEQAKDIYLEAEPFSVENDLLTPTMKSKRPQLKERYKNEIAKMYAKLD